MVIHEHFISAACEYKSNTPPQDQLIDFHRLLYNITTGSLLKSVIIVIIMILIAIIILVIQNYDKIKMIISNSNDNNNTKKK